MTHTSSPLASTPTLYVLATPLGNLRDISLRALDLLRAVDVIAAEDTRHSQRLLEAYGIRARLLALHEHNERQAAASVIGLLHQGKQVALISDAGTPGISDPGGRTVHQVREAGLAVCPVPGPCAAVAALSVAGLSETGFYFVGFLPSRSAARRAELAVLRRQQVPLVVYESPHRIQACVDDLVAVLEPERELVIARELTKMHEQVVQLPLAQAPSWLAENDKHCRGEFVLVVGRAQQLPGLSVETQQVMGLLLEELPLKLAARLGARITGASRNGLYAWGLQCQQGKGGILASAEAEKDAD